jgi:hypothetical protein
MHEFLISKLRCMLGLKAAYRRLIVLGVRTITQGESAALPASAKNLLVTLCHIHLQHRCQEHDAFQCFIHSPR